MNGRAFDLLADGGPRASIGMLTADLANLGSEMAMLGSVGAELVHIDVMDGVFCPMLTVGPPIIKAIRGPFLKDVHLMVNDPLAKVDAVVAAGADMVTFHVEGAFQPHRVLQALSTATNANDPDRGVVRGVGLNPSTPVETIEPLLELADYVLIVAINPGWGGQGYLLGTDRRLEQARRLIKASGRRILLGVDGGVNRDNLARIAGLGVDVVVTGSAVFDGKSAEANARATLETMTAAGSTR